MAALRRIGRNAVFKTLTELVGRALSFIFYVALARWLGEEALGAFSLLYSVGAVAVFLVDPGLNLLLIREAPRDEGYLARTAGVALAAKLALCAACVAAAAGHGLAAGYPPAMVALFALMGAQMAAFALAEYAGALFQARQSMEHETLALGAGKIAVTGAAVLTLMLGGGLAATLLVMTAAQILAAAGALWWAARRGVPLLPRWNGAQAARLLRAAAPLGVVTFFTIAFYRLDVIVAPLLGVGFGPLGHYSAGVKILDVALAAPTLMMAAAFPTLSAMAGAGRGAFRAAANRAVAGVAAAGVAAGAVIWALSDPLVTLLYGPAFAPAAESLRWLAAAAAVMFARHALISVLLLDGRQGSAALFTGLAGALNLALNTALIPPMGVTGMAQAKLYTDVALSLAALAMWVRGRP
ncbi:MAG: oligosaccharide flippase family protein [Nitrospinae bacterium]|nr:oligosaccharide flippase family protein [Nitrospinota bacterium]